MTTKAKAVATRPATKAPATRAKRRKKPKLKYAGQLNKAEAAAALGVKKAVHSIPEFCAENDISIGEYFAMKKRDQGPREIRIGRRVTISHEAAADWRKEREAKSASAAVSEGNEAE